MTSTRAVDPVSAAVKAALAKIGPGLYGVACSGGADSLALAHATIAAAGPAHVVVITIDHGLQPASTSQAAQVAAWATGQGAAAIVERAHVERRASLEAAARDARYAALEAAAERVGLAAVLLGHTQRDQAETVLMRIVRGTGPAGLAGIPPVRGRYVRPLLALPRAAIDAYVATHGLPAWSDPMNDDAALTRARFRRDVLPALRAENPQLDRALARLATTTAEWVAVIDALAAPFATFPIDCAALALQPVAIRKRALALALETAGQHVDYAAGHLEDADDLVTRPAAGQVSLHVPDGQLRRTYDALTFVDAGAGPTTQAPLTVPPGYEVRGWRPGDRMRPARLRGRSRKLSDLFIDAKVPRHLRATARVIVRVHDGEIMWAEHVGKAFGAEENLTPIPA